MSISPSSDIVLGVAKAADPQKYREAVERLTRAAGEGGKIQGAPSAPMTATPTKSSTPTALPTTSSASKAVVSAKSDKQAYDDFEAFFLQTFVEAMLPKDAKSLFGSGPAGKIWKSMLAEHLAIELARSTAFGIAEKIASHRNDKEETPQSPLTEQSASGASAEQAGAEYIKDLQRLLSVDGEMAALGPQDRLQPAKGG